MKQSNKIFIFLFFLLVFVIIILIFTESKYSTKSVLEICGNYPDEYKKIEISNNENYVFTPEANFKTIKLWDVEGNAVLVNSFRECEHYVLGGWNFIPNENYNSSVKSVCTNSNKFVKLYLPDSKVLLIDLTLFEFLKNKNYLCMGEVGNTFEKDGTLYYEVFYSRISYILFTQLFPFIFFLLLIKSQLFKSIFFLIPYQIIFQILFNYKIGFNMVNSVLISSSLYLFSMIYLKRDNK